MKFAYADPPYIGQSKRYPEKQEVDHRALVLHLECEYDDGWALSCSSPTMAIILPLIRSSYRIGAWVKPFAVFKPNVGVAYAWEPVIIHGGRKRTREEPTVRDWVSANITLKKGLVGAKPAVFCDWLLAVLNFRKDEDTLDDLFPGTCSMGEAVDRWVL